MKQSRLARRSTALLLALVLSVATALVTVGCVGKQDPLADPQVENATSVGQGETQFTFTVIDPEGKQSAFLVSTDKTLVGEALQEAGLLQGEEGPYGLYVKTVNGITLDYGKDGKYWAFYVDGQYGEKGVDQTEINADCVYTFRAE